MSNSRAIKIEAAYHEAGHAILAYASRFHRLVGQINLANYGQGAPSISLSKGKLSKEGKPLTQDVELDQDVAKDFALILVGGLVAKQLAKTFNEGIAPNAKCAEPDYNSLRQRLSDAGLPDHSRCFEFEAQDLLKLPWDQIQKIVELLMDQGFADAEDVIELLSR